MPVLDSPVTRSAALDNHCTFRHERDDQYDGGSQATVPPENPPAYDTVASRAGAQQSRSLLGALLAQVRGIGQHSQVDEKLILQAYGAGWKDAHGH